MRVFTADECGCHWGLEKGEEELCGAALELDVSVRSHHLKN